MHTLNSNAILTNISVVFFGTVCNRFDFCIVWWRFGTCCLCIFAAFFCEHVSHRLFAVYALCPNFDSWNLEWKSWRCFVESYQMFWCVVSAHSDWFTSTFLAFAQQLFCVQAMAGGDCVWGFYWKHDWNTKLLRPAPNTGCVTRWSGVATEPAPTDAAIVTSAVPWRWNKDWYLHLQFTL